MQQTAVTATRQRLLCCIQHSQTGPLEVGRISETLSLKGKAVTRSEMGVFIRYPAEGLGTNCCNFTVKCCYLKIKTLTFGNLTPNDAHNAPW